MGGPGPSGAGLAPASSDAVSARCGPLSRSRRMLDRFTIARIAKAMPTARVGLAGLFKIIFVVSPFTAGIAVRLIGRAPLRFPKKTSPGDFPDAFDTLAE